MDVGGKRSGSRAVVALMAVFAVFAFQSSAANAAVTESEELATFGSLGSGAGQLNVTRGMASDPINGHLFVQDVGNNRIDEFTPWGTFVKAFGWGVSRGPVDEQQEVRVQGTEGEFKLSFEGAETGPIPLGASAEQVEEELQGLAGIGAGNVSVTEVPGVLGGSTPFIYTATFEGALAATDVGPLGQAGSSSLTVVARTVVDGSSASAGLQACTTASGCGEGQEGDEPGQLLGSSGLAVDAAGRIYARESQNNRVQVFSPSGQFLLMFGEGVDKTSGGNICTAEDVKVAGDTCGSGGAGTAADSFAAGLGIAIGQAGEIFLPDEGRIQVFASDGSFLRTIAVPGKQIVSLRLDPNSEGFYATFASEEGVSSLSKTGVITGSCVIPKLRPAAGQFAVDPGGDLDAIAQLPSSAEVGAEPRGRIQVFKTGCELSNELARAPESPIHGVFYELTGASTNSIGDLAVASLFSGVGNFIQTFGPAPVNFESPPPAAPTVVKGFSRSIQTTSAELGAFINPHFWTDTRFYVEYGTGECAEGACQSIAPSPSGLLVGGSATNSIVRSPGIPVTGLTPGTTYHYRVVAQSSGGGPVDGGEGTFTTAPAGLPPKTTCTNQVFRSGLSANLSDCRAYEMVSPVDKNNGDIFSLVNSTGFLTALSKSSNDGAKFTYSSYRSFGAPAGAPFTNQYIATRAEGEGWNSESISAPIGSNGLHIFQLDTQDRVFTPNLCFSLLDTASEPPLAPGAGAAGYSPYARSNCSGGSYESLIHEEPPAAGVSLNVEFQGLSADGSVAVFRGPYRLTEDATSGFQQTYVTGRGGPQRSVCILPDGEAWPKSCSAGTTPNNTTTNFQDRYGTVTNALSTDGHLLYWTASEPDPSEDEGTIQAGSGQVYLRENPAEPQSAISGGVCTEPEMACTIKVSGTVSSGSARFFAASPDGSQAIFELTGGTKDGNLYIYEAGGGSTLIAGKVIGVAGFSENLSTVYFVSEQKIGGEGVAGSPNLYVSQEGSVEFIATLSATDAAHRGNIPSDANVAPIFHAAQASADGTALAFISTASLIGYDNTDAASAIPCGSQQSSKVGVCDSEVYIYRVGSIGPVCISCDPSGAQPTGRLIQGPGSSTESLATAASIPAPNYQLVTPHVISADGRRVFFDSFDALVPRDQNGAEDVYEWEAAGSSKQCVEAGAERYVAAAEGCLSLISTGESPKDSEFLDASPGGRDAFFSTAQSLLPQDPGETDVYDAREGGGFPAAANPAPPCEGEACQAKSSAPGSPAPQSSGIGPGNPKSKVCRKGTRKKVSKKGNISCVKHPVKHKKKTGHHKKTHKKKRGHKKKTSTHHHRRSGR
jgi:hypothetical protein